MEFLLVGLLFAIDAGLASAFGWKLGEIHGPFPKRRVRQEISQSFSDLSASREFEATIVYPPMVVASTPPRQTLNDVVEDAFGALYRTNQSTSTVQVVNKTPEPDGTYKPYRLVVPSTVSTPREAIAWTFGKFAEDYSPEVET